MEFTHHQCGHGYSCCNMSRTVTRTTATSWAGCCADARTPQKRACAAEEEEAVAYEEQGEAGIDVINLGPLQMSCRR